MEEYHFAPKTIKNMLNKTLDFFKHFGSSSGKGRQKEDTFQTPRIRRTLFAKNAKSYS